MTEKPALIRQPAVYKMLSITRNGLDNLRKRDASFPKPIKDGSTRQAPCFYVLTEIEEWIEARKQARQAAA